MPLHITLSFSKALPHSYCRLQLRRCPDLTHLTTLRWKGSETDGQSGPIPYLHHQATIPSKHLFACFIRGHRVCDGTLERP